MVPAGKRPSSTELWEGEERGELRGGAAIASVGSWDAFDRDFPQEPQKRWEAGISAAHDGHRGIEDYCSNFQPRPVRAGIDLTIGAEPPPYGRGWRDYARSAGRIGSMRTRFRVAAYTALATAGTMVGVLASPIPPGFSLLGTRNTSTTGISSMRRGS